MTNIEVKLQQVMSSFHSAFCRKVYDESLSHNIQAKDRIRVLSFAQTISANNYAASRRWLGIE